MDYKITKIFEKIMSNWDLLIVILISLLFGLIRLFSSNLVVSIIGLAIMIFLPGYCFSIILFHKRKDLTDIERLTITIFTSIIISAILGFIFISISELNLKLAIFIMIFANTVLAIIGIITRHYVFDAFTAPKINKKTFVILFNKWKRESIFTKILSGLTILSLLGSFGAFVYLLQFSPQIPNATFISIHNNQGKVVSSVRTGTEVLNDLTLNIQNSERSDTQYFLEIWITNKTKAQTLNYEIENMNLTLIDSNSFLIQTNQLLKYNTSFSLSKFGLWSIFFILFKKDKPELSTSSPENLFKNEVIETRIEPVLGNDTKAGILGIWLPVFVLPSIIEDTGDNYSTAQWTIGSEGWNWTATALNTTFQGYRHNGVLDFRSNIESSYLALRVSTRNDLVYRQSNRLFMESRLAPISNVSQTETFGITMDLSYDKPNWSRAIIASNSTHLIMGVDPYFVANESTAYPTIIPFIWEENTFHVLRIDIDYEKGWIAYQCDNIIYRNSSIDKQFISDNYLATIYTDNGINQTGSTLRMDYSKLGWESGDLTGYESKNNLIDTGESYNDNWFTSSEGWDWTCNASSNEYNGSRINNHLEFYSVVNYSSIALQIPISEKLFVQTGEQLIVKVNLTFIDNYTKYHSFGLSIDLFKVNNMTYRANILSNSTHLIMGISANYTTKGFYYTSTIIPFNWIKNDYHVLQINIDYENRWIAYMCDDVVYRKDIADSIYVQDKYSISLIVDNALNESEGIIRIDRFEAIWNYWNDLPLMSISIWESTNSCDANISDLTENYLEINSHIHSVDRKILNSLFKKNSKYIDEN